MDTGTGTGTNKATIWTSMVAPPQPAWPCMGMGTGRRQAQWLPMPWALLIGMATKLLSTATHLQGQQPGGGPRPPLGRAQRCEQRCFLLLLLSQLRMSRTRRRFSSLHQQQLGRLVATVAAAVVAAAAAAARQASVTALPTEARTTAGTGTATRTPSDWTRRQREREEGRQREREEGRQSEMGKGSVMMIMIIITTATMLLPHLGLGLRTYRLLQPHRLALLQRMPTAAPMPARLQLQRPSKPHQLP